MKRFKRALAVLFSVLLLITALPLTAFADEAEGSPPIHTTATAKETMPDESSPVTEPGTGEENPTPKSTTEPVEPPSNAGEQAPSPEPTAAPEEPPASDGKPVPTLEPTTVPVETPVPDPYVEVYEIIDSEIGAAYAWVVPGYSDVSQKYSDSHKAWDIPADAGASVAAADDGIVSTVQVWNGQVTQGDSNSYGHMVQITHDDGNITLYAHLSEINVKEGDTVQRNQRIGRVGETGNAHGPHLHFEVISSRGKDNPYNYFAYFSAEETDGASYYLDMDRKAVGQQALSKVHFNSFKSSYTAAWGTTGNLPAKSMYYGGTYYPAYCIDKDKLVWGDIDFSWSDLSFTQQSTVKQIIAQAFTDVNSLSKSGWGDAHSSGIGKVGNYEPNTMKWAVTQALVWYAMEGYITRNSAFSWTWNTVVDTEMQAMSNDVYNPEAFLAYYAEIKEYLLSGYKIPSFAASASGAAPTILLKWDGSKYTATVTDTNNVLSRYNFSMDGVAFTKNGNQLTISTTKDISTAALANRAYHTMGDPSAVAIWSCVDPAIQRMATMGNINSKVEISAYIKLQTEKPLSGIALTKTSDDGAVAGLKFKLTRNTDSWSQIVTTDENGQISVGNLPIYRDTEGKQKIQYTITEIETPNRYVQPASQTITLTEGKTAEVKFHNKLIRGSLQLLKVDHDGVTPLEGAKYQITDADGNVVTTQTTDKNGKIVVKDLLYGSYHYQEIEAPKGYDLDSAIYDFTVEHDEQVISVTRENVPSIGSISAYKVNSAGTPMSGVSFLLEFSVDDGATWNPVTARSADSSVAVGGCDSPGLKDGVLITGADGVAAFTGLQIDNQTVTIRYRLTEIRTRDGNVLMAGVLFDGSLPDMNGNTEITDLKITAVNNRNFELPNSGGSGFPVTAVGAALIFISLLFTVCYVRRTRKVQ